nr:hypothetical protein [Tanacetum cinerariifolium]
MDLEIKADIEAETAAAAMKATATVDGLGIELVMVVVEIGFKPGLAVLKSESKPEEQRLMMRLMPRFSQRESGAFEDGDLLDEDTGLSSLD